MLRFLFLCLILSASVASNKDNIDPVKSTEGSAFEGDDETDDAETVVSEYEKDPRLESSIVSEYEKDPRLESSINEQQDTEEGSSTIIIIAAVSVIALAIVAATAIFLFRRHLQSREQGVYSVPAEQEQKAVV